MIVDEEEWFKEDFDSRWEEESKNDFKDIFDPYGNISIFHTSRYRALSIDSVRLIWFRYATKRISSQYKNW